MTDKEFNLTNKIKNNLIEPCGLYYLEIKDVKEFIKIYDDDIEDDVIIKMKDVPEHMVGIDLTWLDREIRKIKDRLRNRLKQRAGDKLSKEVMGE